MQRRMRVTTSLSDVGTSPLRSITQKKKSWCTYTWHELPGTKDMVKNLDEAEESLSEVESKNVQRLAGKMLYDHLYDPTIQFEMVW